MKKNIIPSDIEIIASQENVTGKAFWREKFADFPGKVALPFDRKEANEPGPVFSELLFDLDHELVNKILQLSGNSDYRAFIIFLCTIFIIINKYTDREDITIGVPVMKQAGDEEMVNTILPFRDKIDTHAGFREAVIGMKRSLEEMTKNKDYSIKVLLKDLGMNNVSTDCPLFDIGALSGKLHDEEYFHPFIPGLLFTMLNQENGIKVSIKYNNIRYKHTTIEKMSGLLQIILKTVLHDTGTPVKDIPLISEQERTERETYWRENSRNYPLHRSVAALLSERAKQCFDRPAVVYEERVLTFDQLQQLSERVAGCLLQRGVAKGDFVAVLLKRSIETVIAIAGIIRAGAAYVPVSPQLPLERIQYILKDSGTSYVISIPEYMTFLDDHSGFLDLSEMLDENLQLSQTAMPEMEGEDLLYMIYTSGSTGLPKGVMVKHRSVVNLVYGLHEKVYSQYEDHLKLAMLSPFEFDASIQHLFGALLLGHTLVIVPDEIRKDGSSITNLYTKHNVTVSDGTPAHLQLICENGGPLPGSLKHFIIGGDVLDRDLLENCYARYGKGAVKITNVYGPTEACVNSTCFDVNEQSLLQYERIPIGRALPNQRVFIVNKEGHIQPVGIAGEIYIAGEGVAAGYRNDPVLTAGKFLVNAAGERIYRTGDYGRVLPCGNLEFLGRMDDGQVKINGYRIELGEIESVLQRHPLVHQAIAGIVEAEDGSRVLSARIKLKKETEAALFTYLDYREHFPEGVKDLYELPNGLKIFYINAHESDALFDEIFLENVYTSNGIHINNDDIIFDVGANIGLFSIYTGIYAPTAKIYAFEPVTPIYNVLKFNSLLYNLNITLYPAGLSDREEVCKFRFFPLLTTVSRKSDNLIQENEFIGENIFMEPVEIDCKLLRLSDVIKKEHIQRIDLLKIDVEGSELEVINGIDEDDWSKIRQIVLEVHDVGNNIETIRSILEPKGFCIKMDQNGILKNTNMFNMYATRGKTGAGNEAAVKEPTLKCDALRNDVDAIIESVQEYCRSQLPPYFVPDDIQIINRLPLKANGKIDRQSLADIKGLGVEIADNVSSTGSTVKKLVEIMQKMLRPGNIRVNRPFNELGLHSLKMMKFASLVNEELNVKLTIVDVIKNSTVLKLAEFIDEKLAVVKNYSLQKAEKRSCYAQTPGQKRLFFLQTAHRNDTSYNLIEVFDIKGKISIDRLRAAYGQLLERHEGLRTVFMLRDGIPCQRVCGISELSVDIDIINAGGFNRNDINRIVEGFASPFDLGKPLLIRAGLVKLEEEHYLLLLDMHHIITDAQSTGIIIGELVALYNGDQLAPQAYQYKDYSEQQLRHNALMGMGDFWDEEFKKKITRLNLPFDYSRPVKNEFKGDSIRFLCDRSLTAKIDRLGEAHSMSAYIGLLAAINVFLMKITDQNDIIIGTSLSGRTQVDVERIVGLFANLSVIRSHVDEQLRFTEFAGQVKEKALKVIANQQYQFDDMVRKFNDQQVLNRNPIFDVAFFFQEREPLHQQHIKDVAVTYYNVEDTHARFDLSIMASRFGEETRFVFNYNTQLFRKETVNILKDIFIRVLKQVFEAPDARIMDVNIGPEKPLVKQDVDIKLSF